MHRAPPARLFSYSLTHKHPCFNVIPPSCDPEPGLINMIGRKAVGLFSVHSLIPAESQTAAIKSISVCH